MIGFCLIIFRLFLFLSMISPLFYDSFSSFSLHCFFFLLLDFFLHFISLSLNLRPHTAPSRPPLGHGSVLVPSPNRPGGSVSPSRYVQSYVLYCVAVYQYISCMNLLVWLSLSFFPPSP